MDAGYVSRIRYTRKKESKVRIITDLANAIVKSHRYGSIPEEWTGQNLVDCLLERHPEVLDQSSYEDIFAIALGVWRTEIDSHAGIEKPNVRQVIWERAKKSADVSNALDKLLDNPALCPTVGRAVREVVEEIRANDRIKRTTKFEYALVLFLLEPDRPTTLDQLTPIFTGKTNEEQAVRNLLGRLNEKLEKYHARVEHTGAYQLVAIS